MVLNNRNMKILTKMYYYLKMYNLYRILSLKSNFGIVLAFKEGG